MDENNDFRRGLSLALRLGTEMMVSTLVGGSMGYAIDWYFQTRPWFMVFGILLGGAAGIMTVYRIATMTQNDAAKQDAAEQNKSNSINDDQQEK